MSDVQEIQRSIDNTMLSVVAGIVIGVFLFYGFIILVRRIENRKYDHK